MKTNTFILLLFFCATFTNASPIFQTTGVFNFDGILEEQELAERDGDITGVGTSVVTTGIGICDPNFPNPFAPDCPPNTISFSGVDGIGDFPGDTFTMGTVSFFNGDIGAINLFIQSLELEITAINCDTELGCDPDSQRSGSTTLSFVLTDNNQEDIIASADGFCLTTLLGQGEELCAWVPEFDTQSYDIIAQFGSLNIVDIIPVTNGGFVTQGRDPTKDVIHTTIPEPSNVLLFSTALLVLLRLRN